MNTEKIVTSNGDSAASNAVESIELPKGTCYCGEKRNLNIVELLCANCYRWIHKDCSQLQELNNLIPMITNYVYVCMNCSPSGLECFSRNQSTYIEMIITAIANLQQAANKNEATFFTAEKEILSFIEKNWEALNTLPKRVTKTWYANIHRELLQYKNLVFTVDEHAENGPAYGIIQKNLALFKPSYQTMRKLGILHINDTGHIEVPVNKLNKGQKRKVNSAEDESQPDFKKVRPSVDVYGYPLNYPENKPCYRYTYAEDDPLAPPLPMIDTSIAVRSSSKPILNALYRPFVSNTVLLSMHDRAQFLKITEDRLAIQGLKGYCMVRATHSVNRGSWYYEVTIEEMPMGSATRLGWGQLYGNMFASVGCDEFSYGYRSEFGTKFHVSHGERYGEQYSEGDTLGFLIELPEKDGLDYLPPALSERHFLFTHKEHVFYEDSFNIKDKIKKLNILPGSKITFFKNGVSQGVAYEDIYFGSYYPAISIFRKATVSVNFGPILKYSNILKEYNAKAMCQRADELACEQSLSDILFRVEESLQE